MDHDCGHLVPIRFFRVGLRLTLHCIFCEHRRSISNDEELCPWRVARDRMCSHCTWWASWRLPLTLSPGILKQMNELLNLIRLIPQFKFLIIACTSYVALRWEFILIWDICTYLFYWIRIKWKSYVLNIIIILITKILLEYYLNLRYLQP